MSTARATKTPPDAGDPFEVFLRQFQRRLRRVGGRVSRSARFWNAADLGAEGRALVMADFARIAWELEVLRTDVFRRLRNIEERLTITYAKGDSYARAQREGRR
jgi:hypothetical protein